MHVEAHINGRCGCCGAEGLPTNGAWRCEKHMGRLPCLVPGCGRTFKLAPHEDYTWVVMCGRHWRMAPKSLRDKHARRRKRAARRPEDENAQRLAALSWHECKQAVLDGNTLDMTEINAMFGFEPD